MSQAIRGSTWTPSLFRVPVRESIRVPLKGSIGFREFREFRV